VLARDKVIKSEDEMLSHPLLNRDILEERIPGNIRKAEHFMPVLRKLIVYFKQKLATKEL
jgi:DNA excision repair protein ERCC-2